MRQINVRQLIKQSTGFTQMGRAAGHARHGLRPTCGHDRQHLMPQVIARELMILVRRVFDPPQLMLGRVSLKLCARNIEQRPQQMPPTQRALARHPRQASYPGPTQQSEQQGFGLVIAVLGGQ
ncbi:hypothetical protein D9M70_586520 [compost metagenome]